MKEKALGVKYYVLREASTTPEEDKYIEIVIRENRSRRLYSFVGFGLLKDGTITFRQVLENVSAREAKNLIEVLQTQCEEIPKEEFEKAKVEYFRREAELNVSWRESGVFRKYFGIDVITQKQKDIMDQVSKSLKKPRET